MCGLVGSIAARGAAPPDRERVAAATTALSHRGPDGSSHWFSEAAGLGHTRLRIIDLERGDQPMPNEDGSIVTVYNGEIWNHEELRRDLQRAGHSFRSRCDTEVLVHGYEQWGEGLLDHLTGMFAFAIWDTRRERILLARDRVGKKPLYFAETAAGLAFGSDARSVLLAGGLKAELDEGAVPSFLFQRYVNAPRTLFRGISKLRPGELLTYDRTRVERRFYWRLDPQAPVPIERDELRGLVDDAVRRRLMSDVPVGVLLSGGVDSTAVAALARRASEQPLATFTIGFDDPLYDERPLARLTAERLGTEHHELLVRARDFVEALPRLAWYRDEPIAEPSEIPLLVLAELAGAHVKVVLTGDGGDEIFGGYPKYRAERLLRAGGPAAALALRMAGGVAARRPSHRQLARAVETVTINDALVRWASWFRAFSPSELERLLRADLAASARAVAEPLRTLLEPYRGLDPTRRMLVGDFLTYLPDNMLLRGDKVLMAASVEGRMPLLDHRLIERVSNSPGSGRVGLREAKSILRRALADLVPAEILRQPKRGFPVPVARILLEDARLSELLLSERTLSRGLFRPDELRALVSGAGPYGGQRQLKIFTAAALELWFRANVDEVRLRPPEALDDLVEAA